MRGQANAVSANAVSSLCCVKPMLCQAYLLSKLHASLLFKNFIWGKYELENTINGINGCHYAI